MERNSTPSVRISPDKENSGAAFNLKCDTSVAWSAEHRYGNKPLIVDAKLYAEYRKLDQAVEAVKDGENALRESLNQVLYAASTVAN